MGALNPFKAPKVPSPPPIEKAPTAIAVDNVDLTAERMRRAKASGRSSNIVSSLSGAVGDSGYSGSISKLLG